MAECLCRMKTTSHFFAPVSLPTGRFSLPRAQAQGRPSSQGTQVETSRAAPCGGGCYFSDRLVRYFGETGEWAILEFILAVRWDIFGNANPAPRSRCWGHGFRCDRRDGSHYHQNTQYEQEVLNWVTLCPKCREENDEHWRGMWADYWGSVL